MCMSGAHPGSHEPVPFWYKYPHIFGKEIIPALEVIEVTLRRKDRNLFILLEALVLV